MKKVFFMFRDTNDEKNIFDGIRSTLRQSVANNYAFAAVLDKELEPLNEYNAENVDWVRDMEGDVYSTVQANVDTNGLTPITLEELGQKLKEMDVIVPYDFED